MYHEIDWENHRKFITENYNTLATKDICDVIGCSTDAFYRKAKEWEMPKKQPVKAKKYKQDIVLHTGSVNLADYQEAMIREKRILDGLHINSKIILNQGKTGTITSIVGRIVVIRFENYSESFTLFELKRMINVKNKGVKA